MSKKSYGLQTIDDKMTSLLKPIFQGSKKEFILINNLTKNWSEVIGKNHAKFCYVKSIKFNRENKASLTIVVHNPSVGFFIENNSELIIERIAALYGFKSIHRLIVKQEPKDIGGNAESDFKLSEKKENFLQDMIKDIENKELAETLRRLGREIFN